MDIDLVAERFFNGEELLGPTSLQVRDGIVVDISPTTRTPDCAVISPGLVDLQMNGYASHDVSAVDDIDWKALDAELAHTGTTSWLATVITSPLDRLSAVIGQLHERIVVGETGCVGIHCEGPFLGNAPGAHRPQWIIPTDVRWLQTLPQSLRLMTVAPENSGVQSGIRALVGRNVRISLGHSRCTSDEFRSAVSAGASMVTHLFNGMSGVHHRDDGVALWSLIDDRVAVGVITDGVHVSDDAIRLAFRTKAPDALYLVSDSVAWDGSWAQKAGVRIVDKAPRLPDGTLAGSSTPLSECVHHCVVNCGIEMAQVLRAATSVPADLIGETSLGRIVVGQPADIVEWTPDVHVSRVHRRLVFQRG